MEPFSGRISCLRGRESLFAWCYPILSYHVETLLAWKGCRRPVCRTSEGSATRDFIAQLRAEFPPFDSTICGEKVIKLMKDGTQLLFLSLRQRSQGRRFVLDLVIMSFKAGSGPNGFCDGRHYSWSCCSRFSLPAQGVPERISYCCQSTTPVVRP